jgi:hypothetical protein
VQQHLEISEPESEAPSPVPSLLRRMQAMLARMYDAPVEHDVTDFLLTDRGELARFVGPRAQEMSDEQVVVVQDEDDVRVGLFLDEAVLERLSRQDPLDQLSDANLPDYCTALEGVSHFHYLMWSLSHGRDVSLLELELQGEVDKYASALTLITQQRGRFPGSLHGRMFGRVRFLPELDAIARQRYEQANRHAARYCRSIERRFLNPKRSRPEAWLQELRRFFRCGHQEKVRQAIAC